VRRASLPLPHGFAVEHPQHTRIGRVVILDCLVAGRHEGVAGAAFVRRNFGCSERAKREECGNQQHHGGGYRAGGFHSTEIAAEAVSEKPLSPSHSKSNFPLSVAIVKKVTNGLAAIAGNRSARKISSPL